MAEAEGIPPTASVASPGLGLNYILNHVYAWSGTSTYSNETKEVLNFDIGTGYIIGRFFFQYDSTSFNAGERIGYRITLNGNEIVDSFGGDPNQTTPYILQILLPPFTNVLVELKTTDANNINMGMTFVGRVYGAV